MMSPGGFIITDVAAADLDALDGVMRRAFDPRFGEAWSQAQCLAVLSMPGYAIRVARGDAIGGFAIIRWVGDESELLLLAVDPAVRRCGLGRALLDDWTRYVAGRGVRRLFLEMRTDNSALTLYEGAGFASCGLRRGYYRGNDGIVRDAMTMQRILDPAVE